MTLLNTDLTFSFIKLGLGLNDTSGPLSLEDGESPDLQNIDFDKFGSIMPRFGYQILNTSAVSTTNPCLGLYWFRTPTVEKAIGVFLDKVYRMDALDGTWDDITQKCPKLSTSAEYQCDFTTFNSNLLFTNDSDVPKQWSASGSISNMTVVTGLTQAKFITNFQNYCLMANCVVSGVDSPTRIYWSAFKNEVSWNTADNMEIGYNDGQEITGFKVLGDRLVVYKTKSIWVMTFTGNADIPFLRFKTNSSVGCVAPYSIQEVDNGHIFLSWDGLYYFDGNNSYKLSNKVNNFLRSINRDRISYAKSSYQFDKNRYWLSVANSTSTWNNFVLIYDTYNQAFSKYTGMSPSSLAIFSVSGIEERIYFADSLGYVYRADNGVNDALTNTTTAVSSYYYTNWKNFNDICDKKGIPHAYIYHSKTAGTLTFSYAYDFNTTDDYSQSFSMTDPDMYQLLENGNFEIWSLGTSSVPDDWSLTGAGASIARESTIIKKGTYSAKLTRAGTNCAISQQFHTEEGISYWKGKIVTAGCWIYATVANRVQIYLHDGVASSTSVYHVGDSTWQFLTCSLTVDTNANQVSLFLQVDTGDTSGYFDGAIAVEENTVRDYTDKITKSDIGIRRDLTGRGRVVRFKFSNTLSSNHYVIHGLGVQANLQSKA